MLAQRRVNYSTIPAELQARALRRVCNAWLQSVPMRIELPSGSWDTTALRVDDDAHTLTLAREPEEPRRVSFAAAEPGPTLRARVTDVAPASLTLTL